MTRLAAALAVLAALAVGCGSEPPEAPEAARYLDPRSDMVMAVDVDYESGNWQQVKRLYERGVKAVDDEESVPPTLDGALDQVADWAGLSFPGDIKPLLGGTLLIGWRTEPAPALSPQAQDILEQLDENSPTFDDEGRPRYLDRNGRPLRGYSDREIEAAIGEDADRQPQVVATVVYKPPDAQALRRVVDKIPDDRPLPGVDGARLLDDWIAVVDDTLVAVVTFADEPDSRTVLRERLAAGGDGPPVPEVEDDFIAMRAAPSFLGAWLDREELDNALATKPGRAVRNGELRIKLEQDALRARARVDFEGLVDEELPLPEAGALALPTGEPLASASANQSLTTVFLTRLARDLWPDSRFVRRVEALEQREGISFEDDVLRQFAGKSFTVMRPRGEGEPEFAARSDLRDPAAMAALLPRIAPHLPGILDGLQGLGSTGLSGLLFVAPDAPLTPSAFGLLAAIRVMPLPGPDELYEISGLDRRGVRPGPDRVVFGIVGEAFVVASSQELAREAARVPTEPAPDAGTRLRADADALLAGEAADSDDARVVRALVAGLEASASAQDGDIEAEAEVRWAE